MRGRRFAATALLVAFIAAGCGGDAPDLGSTSTTTAADATSTTTTNAATPSGPSGTTRVGGPSPPSGTPSPSRIPSQNEPLEPNGYYFGYIRSIGRTPNPSSIEFDVAEFLTGQQALEAALEDGQTNREEGLPNDFYIRNRSIRVRTVEVSPDVTISLFRCVQECAPVVATWGDLVSLLTGPYNPNRFYGTSNSVFWVTLRNGMILKIEEQYIP